MLHFTINTIFNIGHRFYNISIYNYLKKSLILCLIELIICIIMRILSNDLFLYIYPLYSTTYSLNTFIILYKILNMILNQYKSIVNLINKNCNLLKISMRIIITFHIIKLLFQLAHLLNFYELKIYISIISILIWFFVIDMIIYFYKEIKTIFFIILENLDNETLKLLDINIIINIIIVIYPFIL